jgi:hypothetical protein
MISLFDHDPARLVFTKENHRRSSRQKHAVIESDVVAAVSSLSAVSRSSGIVR